jgi:hypothetical protein
MDKAEALLREAYEYAGMEAPDWLKLKSIVETITEVYEDLRETVRGFIVEKINEEYSKFVGRVTVEAEGGYEILPRSEIGLRDRAKIVIEKQLIPWLIGKENIIYITTGIVEDLKKNKIEAGDLKSLAEMLGWEYIPTKPMKMGGKTTSRSVVKVDLEDFLNFLEISIE